MIETIKITKAEFEQFQRLIYKIAGISLADSKQVLLVGRLGRRLRHYNFSTFAEYYKLVSSGIEPDELQMMVDLLTTINVNHQRIVTDEFVLFPLPILGLEVELDDELAEELPLAKMCVAFQEGAVRFASDHHFVGKHAALGGDKC